MMHRPTSLTEEQHARRQKGIGGSDAKKIMAGEWLALWQEKTGRGERPDFSNMLHVQMGIATEALNAWWYERKTGIPVLRPDTFLVHPVHKWMICNLDGAVIIGGKRLPWDAKHTNSFGDDTEVVTYNYAQAQHNMEVSGADEFRLSAFYGTSKWKEHRIPRDVDYISELLMREEQFWWHVEKDKEPPSGMVIPVAAPKIEKPRVVDMTAGNQAPHWKKNAAIWLKHRDAVKAADAAESELKTIMPVDAGLAHGHGIAIARAANGNLSLRSPTKKDRERIEEAKGEDQ